MARVRQSSEGICARRFTSTHARNGGEEERDACRLIDDATWASMCRGDAGHGVPVGCIYVEIHRLSCVTPDGGW